MRERIFADQVSSTVREEYWLYEWTSTYAFKRPATSTTTEIYAAMLDEETPNFKKRSSKGEIIINPLLSQKFIRHSQHCFVEGRGFTANYPNKIEKHELCIARAIGGARFNWLTLEEYLEEFQDERDKATSKAWANVDISEMQALASLGEMPETVKWIGSLYTRMVNVLRMFSKKQVRRQVLKNLKRLSKKQKLTALTDTVSNFWLELRYAVRPLVFEMIQAVAALKKAVDTAQRYTARGFEKAEADSTTNLSGTDVNGYVWAHTRRDERFSNYRAGVLYRIEADVNKLSSVWGLNQGFETFWELTPMSFIYDWFFNIGDVISSWNITSGLSPLGSWITEQHIIKQTSAYAVTDYVGTSWAYNVQKPVLTLPGETTAEWLIKRRIPNPSRSILPHCSVNLDVAKLLDLAAIGRGLLKALKPKTA